MIFFSNETSEIVMTLWLLRMIVNVDLRWCKYKNKWEIYLKNMSLSAYGKLPKGERLKRIKDSPNYKNGSFQNLSKTNAMAEDVSFFKTMKDFFNKPNIANDEL